MRFYPLLPVNNSIFSPLECYFLQVFLPLGLWTCWLWICDCSHLHWLRNTCCCSYYQYSITIVCNRMRLLLLLLSVVLSQDITITVTVGLTYHGSHCLVSACYIPALLISSLTQPLPHPVSLVLVDGLPPLIESWDPLKDPAF